MSSGAPRGDEAADGAVDDWATDYDILDEGYVRDPGPIWKELRGRCPIAHTTRWGGSWLTTRYDDVQAMVRKIGRAHV